MKPSMKTLSELTGFSQATVSNALNHKRGVNKETAEIIHQVAKENGYNIGAKVTSINFVMYSAGGQVMVDTPFFTKLIEGVELGGRESGFKISIVRLNKDSPDYLDLRNQLLRDPGGAILLLGTELSEEDARPFLKAAAPIVLLDSYFPDLPIHSICMNNSDSVRQAVEYLLKAGHKRIGYLKSKIRIQNFIYREKGYREALQFRNIVADPDSVIALTPTMEGAYVDMKDAISTTPVLPTAFFADNDIIAFGAMKALQESGFIIPDDISIIGFDDLPYCSISTPALTTIRVFQKDMALFAIHRFIELMQYGNTAITQTHVQNELIERDSVRII